MPPMLVILLTVALDLVGFGLVIPLLTYYAESFHATPVQVTSLMACYSLAQFVGAPLWGQLSDRIGRRPVMLISIGMTALMLAAFASATQMWMLFLFRTLHGLGTANIGTAQACMADITTPAERAKGMGMIGAAFGLGFTFGPLLGGELSRISLTAPIWAAAGLSALNFVMALFLLPETRKPDTQRHTRTISPVALLNALRHPVVGMCILLVFVQVFAFAVMESTFTLFAEHVHGLGATDVGRVFGLIGLIGIFIQGGLIRPLVRRFGEAPLVTTGLVVLALGLVALPLAPQGALLLGVCGLIAIGQSLVTPSLNALLSRAADPSEQGAVLGSAQSMSALARTTGPALGGALFSASMGLPFWVSAALLLVAAALSVPAGRRAMSGRT